jgi:hypothetical protein
MESSDSYDTNSPAGVQGRQAVEEKIRKLATKTGAERGRFAQNAERAGCGCSWTWLGKQ